MKLKRTMVYVFVFTLILLNIAPFWIMFVNATRSSEQIQQGLSLIPSTHMMNNWNVLTGRGFSIFNAFRNSLIISVGATVLNVYFSCLTAYAISVYDFKGKKLIFSIILIMMMVPAQLSIVGFYRLMLTFNLVDSFIPLIVPAICSPITVFFFKQYFDTTLHKDLIQAARIDGCGELGIYHRIVIPLAKPAMATMAIFSMVATWNNYLTPLTLLTSEDKYTLPMLVQLLKADIYSTEYGGIYLGLSVAILPLIVIYFALSKYIIEGIALGGVKE